MSCRVSLHVVLSRETAALNAVPPPDKTPLCIKGADLDIFFACRRVASMARCPQSIWGTTEVEMQSSANCQAESSRRIASHPSQADEWGGSCYMGLEKVILL